MKITTAREWDLEASTLAELRQVVAEAEGLPDDAVVRVRTRFVANSDGAAIRRVRIRANQQRGGGQQ